jgi:ribulose kinase
MQLEMEVPKILWLKNHMNPFLFSKCQFFDLPDFLTYRATNNTSRSSCSLICKTSYVPSGWHDQFFHQIGLDELVKKQYSQVGADEPLIAGIPVGEGLTKGAAEELGLKEGTPVGSAIIDACVFFSLWA